MANPATGIPQLASVKNIIFDFGGVICDIDVRITEQRFRDLGMKGFDPSYSITGSENIFSMLEAGKITPAEFRKAISRFLPEGISDVEIDEAWNAMLLEIPGERVRLLERLKKNYRIFLLSNSNEIHYNCYIKRFRESFGYEDFNHLFEKAYFSFRLRMKKPGREIFDHVVADSRLDPSMTLFIDDSPVNLEGAAEAGIIPFHLEPGTDILNVFPRTE